MARLSVNINKVATLRNARGGRLPDVVEAALACERFGADGITVHPRPDERHIRYADVRALRPVLTTEFNIEGYPSRPFLDLVRDVRPHQVTLVPDAPDVVTSDAGWDVAAHADLLKDVVAELKAGGARVSLFLDPDPRRVAAAARTGADRIELYTEAYASRYPKGPAAAVKDYVATAEAARDAGLGVNAGHDLDLGNLAFLVERIPFLAEVSIGHALIADALYLGLENAVGLYKRKARGLPAASPGNG